MSYSVDFLPPLHHALVYNWVWRSFGERALSSAGLVLIGPFNHLYLVPSSLQTTTFGQDHPPDDRGPVYARADSGLLIVLTAAVQWHYDAATLPSLFPTVQTDPPSEEAPRTYLPAKLLVRQLAYTQICHVATRYTPHDFFFRKAEITEAMLVAVRRKLGPYVRVAGLQLLRVDSPNRFEEGLMTSALMQLQIVAARRMQEARKVELRTLSLAARFEAVATVKRAGGAARSRRQRAAASVAMTQQTVDAEIAAFRNVSSRIGSHVTPWQVLDYAYWQLGVGDTAPGMRDRPPLHDVLLGPRRLEPARRASSTASLR